MMNGLSDGYWEWKGENEYINDDLQTIITALNAHTWKSLIPPVTLTEIIDTINSKLRYNKRLDIGNYHFICKVAGNFRNDKLYKITGALTNITDIITENEKVSSTRDDAVNLLKTKNIFIENMNHEMRTPLNGIVSMAELLSKESLNSEQMNMVKVINQSSEHLLHLITDILEYSNLSTGKTTVENKNFNPTYIISRVCSLQKNTKFQTTGLNIPRYIISDPYRFQQIFTNLTAFKTSEIIIQGEHTGEAQIRLLFTITLKNLLLSSANDLFGSFSRVDTRRQNEGFSLGLAICKQLCNNMGGNIIVTNNATDTLFRFNILVKKGVIPLTRTISTLSKPIKNLNILIVEDIHTNAYVLRKLLAKLDITNIIHLENGQLAVDFMSAGEIAIDVIFMDMCMPVLDGLDATLLIRKFNTNVKIIALTANSTQEEAAKCLASGMNFFLSKPITVRAIEVAIRSVFHLEI